MRNYYDILGISTNATQVEIKTAFKKLAVKYHPDKNNGDEHMEERFKEINLVYQVLSNPFEKAKYDITLIYGQGPQSSNSSPYTDYSHTNQQRYSRQKTEYSNRRYTKPKVNWRENWIATAYALGFTFVVASIFMVGITVKDYIAERKFKKSLIERRAVFNEAKLQFENNNIDDGLLLINSLGMFLSEENDMKEYKLSIFESFIYQAESNFNRGEYAVAIDYFELIEKYSISKTLTLKEHHAISYKATNQPHKAIKILKELLVYNYRNLEIYVSLAEIYRDMIKNNEEALRYFKLGDAMAIKKYELIYGKAYSLVMDGEFLPPVHYRLYSGLADIHLKLGNPEMAIKTTRWNVNIWPDSTKCFITAALSYQKIGKKKKACDSYTQARALGASEIVGINCP
ncbi:MAG: DnaJ domain-containing protein [Cyclobacteriaceae bacterium]